MDGLKKAFCDQKMSRNFSIREGIQEGKKRKKSSENIQTQKVFQYT